MALWASVITKYHVLTWWLLDNHLVFSLLGAIQTFIKRNGNLFTWNLLSINICPCLFVETVDTEFIRLCSAVHVFSFCCNAGPINSHQELEQNIATSSSAVEDSLQALSELIYSPPPPPGLLLALSSSCGLLFSLLRDKSCKREAIEPCSNEHYQELTLALFLGPSTILEKSHSDHKVTKTWKCNEKRCPERICRHWLQ